MTISWTDKVLVALEARAIRQAVRLEDTGLVNSERRPLGAAAALPPGAPGGIGRLLHATGLEFGASLQAFEPRDLLAQFGVLCLQPGALLQGLRQQRLQLFEAKPGNLAGRFGHAPRESPNESAVSHAERRCPDFCPCYN